MFLQLTVKIVKLLGGGGGIGIMNINYSLKADVSMVRNVYISIERDICYQSTSRSLAPQMHASQSSPFKSAHITRNNQSDPSKPPDRWNRESPCHSCTVSCFDQSVTSSIKKKILYDAVDFIAYILSYKYDRMIYYHIFACILSGWAKSSINHRSLLFEYIFF